MEAQSFFLCFFILVIFPDHIYGRGPIAKVEKPHSLLFVFGDSLFDAGNNQYISNSSLTKGGYYWPYGMNFHNHSTGRVSDGLVVPDFIALKAKLPITQPYLQPGVNFTYGTNFASAGSTVMDNSRSSGVMNLRGQLSCLKKVVESMAKELGDKGAKKMLLKSVFLFSSGGNDYNGFSMQKPNANQSERQSYQRMVVGNLTDVFKEIYGMGGRKFAIQNVGPMGCYPMSKQMSPQTNGACVKNSSAIAQLHNKALFNALTKLQAHLPDFKFSVFDYYHSLLDRSNNPSKYGFKEGNIACCGTGTYKAKECNGSNLCSNPNEYVFFDGAHHTQQTNRQLADLLWNGSPPVTKPLNVKQLFDLL